jgi:hypothetical protein
MRGAPAATIGSPRAEQQRKNAMTSFNTSFPKSTPQQRAPRPLVASAEGARWHDSYATGMLESSRDLRRGLVVTEMTLADFQRAARASSL